MKSARPAARLGRSQPRLRRGRGRSGEPRARRRSGNGAQRGEGARRRAGATRARSASAAICTAPSRRSPTSRPTWSSTCASRSTARATSSRCCRCCSSARGWPTPARRRSRSGSAVHKHKAKDVLRGAGVPTPEAAVLTAPDVSKVALGVPAHRQAGARGRLGRHHGRLGRPRSRGARASGDVRAGPLPAAGAGRALHRGARDLRLAAGTARAAACRSCRSTRSTSRRCRPAAPRIVSFDGKWVESSPEFRGTKPVPCEGLSASDAGPDRGGRRDGVRGDGAARLRPPRRAAVGRRHPLRHRREPQLRSVGGGGVRAGRARRRARI